MRARDAAAAAKRRLLAAGVAEPAFEAEYLVRTAASLSRAEFFGGKDIASASAQRADGLIERRLAREPANYITGTREFWGLDFEVGSGVLVPRPETELLVQIALDEECDMVRPVIIDVGTGTGCIAIALQRELGARAAIVAIDLSSEALAYARRNASEHGAPVSFIAGDLTSGVRRADIVLANLPYIPTDEIDALEPEVSRWEPRIALDGGADGYALIRRLLDDCALRLRPGLLALEVGFGMANHAVILAGARGAATTVIKDLAGIDRVVCCRWP